MDGGLAAMMRDADPAAVARALERETLRRKARTDLIAFTEYTFPKYRPVAHHRAIARVLEAVLAGKIDRLMILTAPRHGKKCANDTPVWTPTGWRTHGELLPGDWVYHPSGKPIRVVAISEETPVDREVRFSNGDAVQCHAQHEWPTRRGVLETRALFPGDPLQETAVTVTEIRKVPPKPGRCIQVDSPDGLYLVGRSMIPTHNSELCSRRFPAFALGQNPELEFMSTSAGADLAGIFGGEVRDIIQSPEYQEVFPGTAIKEDEAAKGRWRTSSGGAYNAFGVGGRPVGFGGDIIMIDDPFGSMDDATSETVRARVQSWYSGTLYHRLQPNGKIVLINHRMHEDDLSGYLLRQESVGGDEWFVLCLPAELDEAAAEYLGRNPGEALWPEAFPLEDLRRKKSTLGSRHYAALYLQDPKAAEDGIHKRSWFKPWESGEPFPVFDFVIQSYDTAFTDSTKNDATAMVTLGVFRTPGNQPAVMLIDAWEERISYPDLRKKIRKEWEDTTYGQTWMAEDEDGMAILDDMNHPLIGKGAETPQGRKADVVLIENKGSGVAIIRELRQNANVPIVGFNAGQGFSSGLGLGRGDKTSRAHAVAPYAEAGRVYIPESGFDHKKFVDWAEPLVDQLVSYKFEGSIQHDDLMDAYTQALLYIINYGLLSVEDIEDDDDDRYADDDWGEYDEDESVYA